MSDQIELLANYIMAEVPGEPSQNEGAGDCAIRLLKQYKVLLDAVNAYRMAHSAAEANGSDATGDVYNTYVTMLVAADQFNPEVTKR